MSECIEVTYSKVLDFIGDLVEDFVLPHAVWIVVATEANDDQAVLLAEDGLVDVPSCSEMWEYDGTHVGVWLGLVRCGGGFGSTGDGWSAVQVIGDMRKWI